MSGRLEREGAAIGFGAGKYAGRQGLATCPGKNGTRQRSPQLARPARSFKPPPLQFDGAAQEDSGLSAVQQEWIDPRVVVIRLFDASPDLHYLRPRLRICPSNHQLTRIVAGETRFFGSIAVIAATPQRYLRLGICTWRSRLRVVPNQDCF